ncbi:(Fe-S)-binding protein [Viridibacterium curvum]|uniref:(Fe-S)-binding protein n=1 Tax=Viridibacterium curvum TaxID=1101404 RepID=A0ABP9R6I1_9RHOO
MNAPVTPQLDWSAYDSYGAGDAYAQLPSAGGGFGKAAAVCIGNRQCQREEKGVMCPSYRATQNVQHSTHHRAATLKAALNGELGVRPFLSDALTQAMNLCVGCKGCKRECPNGTDMALLKSESLAQRWLARGKPPLRERLLAGVPRLLPWLRRLAWLVSLRNRVPLLASLAERITGISARRTIPAPAASSFLATQEDVVSGPEGGREVALFVDTFSNELEPANAQAARELLVTAGYRVHLVRAAKGERPLCCGRTWLSSGLIEAARTEAQRVVDALWTFVERDIPVVGLEASCLLMLRDEYHALGLGERVPRIAKGAFLLEEFLVREHDAKRLQLCFADAAGRRVAVHGHCHQKAFGAMKAMRKLLGLVPGLQVTFIESSCCGMAGGFGFEAEHYDVSMRMAELSLLPALRHEPAETRVIANGMSCRHQIRDGAQRDSQHVVRLLRDALQDVG